MVFGASYCEKQNKQNSTDEVDGAKNKKFKFTQLDQDKLTAKTIMKVI